MPLSGTKAAENGIAFNSFLLGSPCIVEASCRKGIFGMGSRTDVNILSIAFDGNSYYGVILIGKDLSSCAVGFASQTLVIGRIDQSDRRVRSAIARKYASKARIARLMAICQPERLNPSERACSRGCSSLLKHGK